MTQSAVPIQDVTPWPTGNYGLIDEVPIVDGDYVESAAGPVNSPMVVKLSGVTDPLSSTGHILHLRWEKDNAGASQLDGTYEVRQGYVSEANKGTLIMTGTVTNIGAAFVAVDDTLSAGEADAITDYSNLYIRIVANAP